MLKVKESIDFLAANSPDEFEFVSGKVTSIVAGSLSQVIVQEGRYEVNESDLQNSRVEWFASDLVHEAVHVQQYKEGRNYFGPAAEREAENRQHKVLDDWGLGFLGDIATSDNGQHVCDRYPNRPECQ